MRLAIDIGYDPKKPLYRNIDMTFRPGERINIIGDNGSGKSTFYKTLTGAIPPIRGSVPVEVIKNCAIISDQICPPEEILVDDIYEAVGFEKINRLKSQYPQLVSVLNPCRKQKVRTLSSGQRRMLEIISVLSMGKRILILDEAFNSLDLKNRKLCIGMIRSLHDTVVFSTSHNLEDVVDFDGRVIGLDKPNGKFVLYEGVKTVETLSKFMLTLTTGGE